MKSFLRKIALIAICMVGFVSTQAGTVLTYDFMTNCPSTSIRIDQGYKEVRGNFAFWTGEWAGLFGNKIAFDASSCYYSLKGGGGLVDYHDHQKLYIMDLAAGDKITFYYSGTNAKLEYHISSTASMQELTQHFDSIASGVTYHVNSVGYLCVLNKFSLTGTETIINKIVIETQTTAEVMDLTYGMCTFSTNVPLDFSSLSTVRAYVATSYDGSKFIFKEIKYLPASTGCLVVAKTPDVKTVTVPVGQSSNYRNNAISRNLFVASLTRSYVTAGTNKCFVFGVTNGNVGIYNAGSGFTTKAKKAYLSVSL